MIRMIQSKAAGHAKSYFSEALQKADYYISDQEMPGIWQGLLAHRFGLHGETAKEPFFALCDNRHPFTGAALTPRTRAQRTVGYDINFHCPKSVSILHALSGDSHILQAFHESVTETMRMIEADSKTRVRRGGVFEDRKTGALAWAQFIHQTARPVGQYLPDPHLHAHCFTFNATWDDAEQRVKAGQFRDIMRDMPYYRAAFHNALAGKLSDLGYAIRRTDKSFEIDGVPRAVIGLFSKRTDEIGRVAREKGITDPAELAGLGARTRARKKKDVIMADLRKDWLAQVNALPLTEQNAPVRFAPKKDVPTLTARECLDFAMAHCFERASVIDGRRLLQTACRHALGKGNVAMSDIATLLDADPRIIHVLEKGRKLCTTKEVLAEEKRMIDLFRAGQGKMRPLYPTAPALALSGQQAAAVAHVLTTTHRVSNIRGVAGAGKTTLMKEAVAHIEATGRKVLTVAPTASAAHGVLKDKEGFKDANTVARLLVDKDMQAKLKNNVLWVDEAGLLGTRDMTGILQIAQEQNARVILGGDTRQHASVARGDALRVLNVVGGLQAAEVNKIYRQHRAEYRAAVEALAKGDIQTGFKKLEEMGAIHEVDPSDPGARLVKGYAEAVKEGRNALAVCPTHAQGDALTAQIRHALRDAGLLGKKEISALRLKPLGFTDAEKADVRNYQPGQVVQFTQNAPGFTRGSRWDVAASDDKGVTITDGDAQKALPLDKTGRFGVFAPQSLALSKGDKVRIMQNGFDKGKKRLNNGDILDVVHVAKHGDIVLQNPTSKNTFTLGQDYGHIAHGHCVTSHAAQGKTVDDVFIFQPAATFAATNARQFYVSASRARDGLHIYTDDKAALLHHALADGDRLSAHELLYTTQRHQEIVAQQERLKAASDTPPTKPKEDKNRGLEKQI